jgi:hypothetical protein
MALMANDPNDLVDQLTLLTRRLADIAERQAALFEASRFDDAQVLNDEASRLAATYALESHRISQDSGFLNSVDPALKLALKAETERFRTAIQAHERTLERRRVIAEGLVRAIAEEALAARAPPVTYGPRASHVMQNSAVALDRRA